MNSLPKYATDKVNTERVLKVSINSGPEFCLLTIFTSPILQVTTDLPNKVFTSFDIAASLHELKDSITNSRVNNIYQLNKKTLLFKLHKTGIAPILLLLEAGRRFHMTTYEQEKPESPPSFCLAIRKHLRNAWLRKIEQFEFERIVIFTFETSDNLLRLILEIFGDGNLILTNEKGEIIQALILKRMRDRNILRGETYAFPPSSGKDPFKTSKEDLAKDLKKCGEGETVRALARGLGIGGVYAEETLLRAGVEKTTQCTNLTDAEIDSIYASLQNFSDDIANARFKPHIIISEDGTFLDVVPFLLRRYETCKSQSFSNFNEALDQFYLRVVATEKAASDQTNVEDLKREADRLKRVATEQERTVREAEIEAEHDRLVGDSIYANSVEIQSLLAKLQSVTTAAKDHSSLTSEIVEEEAQDGKHNVVVEDIDTKNLTATVRVGTLHFSINFRRSLFENAAHYYEKGKKTKQKGVGAMEALKESRQKLAELEMQTRNAEVAQLAKPAELLEEMTKRRIQGKEWFEKFRWFISSDRMLVVAGKDAVSNEVLVKRHTAREDPVFHADIPGAPFVVVKAEGRTPSEQTMCEAGEFAAAFSRAWREGLGSVDVYWVRPDQLSKTGPSGEYVTHGAFAVTGKRNWMRNVTLRTAIGVTESLSVQFLGGPVDAVKTHAKIYVKILPGDVMGKEILRQTLLALAAKASKEQSESIVNASIEEIREFVPYTMGRIMDEA